MNKFLTAIILQFFVAQFCTAQLMDTLLVKPVNIHLQSFQSSQNLDSLSNINPFQSVGDVLSSNSSVYLNNYGGRGQIQSLSIRGLTSSHNKIKWNGLQINGLTLGMLNLAGLSSNNFSSIELYSGNTVWNDGDGAIGGALHLNNSKEYNKGTLINLRGETGSFGTYASNVGVTVSKKNFIYSLQTSKEYVENNYTYINTTRLGKPEEVLTNSEFWNTNIVQEVYGKVKNVKLKSVTFLSGRRQNSPPMLTERSSNTFTADSSFRQVISSDFKLRKIKTNIVVGLDRQTFEYNDEDNNIFTYYKTNNYQSDLNLSYKIKSFNFRLKSNFQHQSATNNNYSGVKTRAVNSNTISSLYQQKKYNFKTNLSVGIQSESLNHSYQPVLNWGYNKGYRLFEFKGGAGLHNRLPSFNDLFWFNGGNNELSNEYGWNIEQSVKFKVVKNYEFVAEFGAYYTIIDDWIQWLSENDVWFVQNVKKVEAKGVETSLCLGFSFKEVDFKFNHKGALTYTTILKAESKTDPTIGKQAINVPFINSNQIAEVIYKKYILQLKNRYTGLRYTSTGNDEKSALDPFWINDVSIHKEFNIKAHKIFTKFSVNNLFDLNYKVVANRPMPGRAYYLTIQYKFNKK